LTVEVLDLLVVIEDIGADLRRVGQKGGNLDFGGVLAGGRTSPGAVGTMRFVAAVPEEEGLVFGPLLEEIVEIGGVVVRVNVEIPFGDFVLVEGGAGGVMGPTRVLEVRRPGALAG
jgi:hypothetical protein